MIINFCELTGSSTSHLADEEIRLRVYAKDISLTVEPDQDSSILNIIPVKLLASLNQNLANRLLN